MFPSVWTEYTVQSKLFHVILKPTCTQKKSFLFMHVVDLFNIACMFGTLCIFIDYGIISVKQTFNHSLHDCLLANNVIIKIINGRSAKPMPLRQSRKKPSSKDCVSRRTRKESRRSQINRSQISKKLEFECIIL